jgi:hypothetical protein
MFLPPGFSCFLPRHPETPNSLLRQPLARKLPPTELPNTPNVDRLNTGVGLPIRVASLIEPVFFIHVIELQCQASR